MSDKNLEPRFRGLMIPSSSLLLGTFRTKPLELMMSVHWVKADIAVASVEIDFDPKRL
jgi:hypothetical protein